MEIVYILIGVGITLGAMFIVGFIHNHYKQRTF